MSGFYEPMITENDLDYLEHHQVLGGKWGILHGPPYPLGSGQSTGKSIKKGAEAKSVDNAVVKRVAANASESGGSSSSSAKTSKPDPEKEAVKHETNRRKAIDAGDYDDIMKFRGEMSMKDLQKALDRLEKEDKIQKLQKEKNERLEAEKSKKLSDARREVLNEVDDVWVRDHLSKLSNDEVKYAMDRIDLANKVQQRAAQQIHNNDPDVIRGKQIAERNAKVKDLASKGTKIYNYMATMHNYAEPDDPWFVIDWSPYGAKANANWLATQDKKLKAQGE